jgi:hypothetical protein
MLRHLQSFGIVCVSAAEIHAGRLGFTEPKCRKVGILAVRGLGKTHVSLFVFVLTLFVCFKMMLNDFTEKKHICFGALFLLPLFHITQRHELYFLFKSSLILRKFVCLLGLSPQVQHETIGMALEQWGLTGVKLHGKHYNALSFAYKHTRNLVQKAPARRKTSHKQNNSYDAGVVT